MPNDECPSAAGTFVWRYEGGYSWRSPTGRLLCHRVYRDDYHGVQMEETPKGRSYYADDCKTEFKSEESLKAWLMEAK